MSKEGTKEAAEAVLRELPSVIGAFVREDVHGHPREIHLLVRAGPNPRHLAYDVRDLLEERLGIPVDQRVISIAQLAPGREPGTLLPGTSAAGTPAPEPAGVAAPAEAEPDTTEPRLRFHAIASESVGSRVRIRVTLDHGPDQHSAEAVGLDTLQARIRSAAAATMKAVDAACVGRARFEVEHVSLVHAFERDYALVTILVSSPFLGRKPVALVGAHPVDVDDVSAAALAALKAVNRTLSLVLRLSDAAPQTSRRRPGRS